MSRIIAKGDLGAGASWRASWSQMSTKSTPRRLVLHRSAYDPINLVPRGIAKVKRQAVFFVKRVTICFTAPDLSLIVPAYNCESHVEKAIRSVLNQGVRGVEVIVVDDMSTDGTRDVVGALAARDPRVKLLSSGVNGGPGRARNIGVQAARGKYIAFVDADDRVLPNAYKRMLQTIKKSGSDFISGGYRRAGRAGGHRPDVTTASTLKSRLGLSGWFYPVPQELGSPSRRGLTLVGIDRWCLCVDLSARLFGVAVPAGAART